MVRDGRYVIVMRGRVSYVGRSVGRSVGRGVVGMVKVIRVGRGW